MMPRAISGVIITTRKDFLALKVELLFVSQNSKKSHFQKLNIPFMTLL